MIKNHIFTSSKMLKNSFENLLKIFTTYYSTGRLNHSNFYFIAGLYFTGRVIMNLTLTFDTFTAIRRDCPGTVQKEVLLQRIRGINAENACGITFSVVNSYI
jgi:hypothetical protein